MLYGELAQRSAEYKAMESVREAIEDFYVGGWRLAERVGKYIPKLSGENPRRYANRIKAGAYLNYFGQITDYYASALFTQELSVRPPADADESTPGAAPDDDDVYSRFSHDASGEGQTLNEVLHGVVITALKQKTAWLRVEMPPPADVTSKAEEEALGLGIPYLFEVSHDEIIDWDVDDDDELTYAVLYRTKALKGPPGKRPNKVRETFEVWTRDAPDPEASVSWQRYELVRDADKKPQDNTEVPLVEEGTVSFPRIPLLRMCLPDGLWLGNKLCPLAREHYQRRCTLNAAENASMVAIPVAKLAASIGEIGAAVEDQAFDKPQKGMDPVSRLVASGYEVIGDKDSIEFAEPKGTAYDHVARQIDSLKDEMFRVAHQMAASANMHHAGAMKRSGESKKEDRMAEGLVLAAIGRIVRNFAIRIYDTISRARKEDVRWVAHGLDTYELEDREQVLEEAVSIALVAIPSPTFRKEHTKRLARKLVPNMPPATIATIDDEIDHGVDDDMERETLMKDAELDQKQNPPAPVIQPPAGAKPASAKAPKSPKAPQPKAAA